MRKSRFFSAIFLQFTGTVGSVIFVLPYLFAKSNFLFASLFLVYLTIITAFLNHFYVEIIRSTPGDHQLTGYSEIYLGKKFKLATSLNLFLLAFGGIAAYSKLFQTFYISLFPSASGFSAIIFLVIIFFLFIFYRRFSNNFFVLIPIFMLTIPVILFVFSLLFTSHQSLTFLSQPNFAFFGVTLFAVSGFTIIPEVQETLGTNVKFSLVVLLGLLLSSVIFFLFAFAVVKLSGPSLSINSVDGLAKSYPYFGALLAVLGMVITTRSSTNFLIILREVFYRDLNLSLPIATILPFIFPILALGLTNISLITIISLTGGITIFVSAVIICLIRFRLPHNFITLFISLLILLSLFFGLAGVLLN